MSFDVKGEESKIHDPFLGRKMITDLKSESSDLMLKSQTFFGDHDIEQQLKIPHGIVSRVTSSFLISYKNPENGDKMVVDLGLNIKNYSKKLHVPQYVRFV